MSDEKVFNKLPPLTALYWILKITATTLGETAGDLTSMTMEVGYGLSTVILMSLFLVSFAAQMTAKTHRPWLYWIVILTTSTAGTTMSDWMDRTLGLGYLNGSLILIGLLLAILAYWHFFTPYSMSVTQVQNPRIEFLYWMAILFSNTLGTALGDYLADDSGLGFAGVAAILAASLLLILVAYRFSRVSRVFLFWVAFVQTRPLGATLGDTFTKTPAQGGLGFGTIGTSAVLIAITVLGVIAVSRRGYSLSRGNGWQLGSVALVLACACAGGGKQEIPLTGTPAYVLQPSGTMKVYPGNSARDAQGAQPLHRLRVKRKNEGASAKTPGCWQCTDCICNGDDCSCTECTAC